MPVKNREMVEDGIRDLSLLMETASDLVTSLNQLALSVERCLSKSSDVDEVISLLRNKKSKVDTLNAVALELTSWLKVSSEGDGAPVVPEGLKIRFRELMADLRKLLDREARIEELIAGRGFPVSRKLR